MAETDQEEAGVAPIEGNDVLMTPTSREIELLIEDSNRKMVEGRNVQRQSPYSESACEKDINVDENADGETVQDQLFDILEEEEEYDPNIEIFEDLKNYQANQSEEEESSPKVAESEVEECAAMEHHVSSSLEVIKNLPRTKDKKEKKTEVELVTVCGNANKKSKKQKKAEEKQKKEENSKKNKSNKYSSADESSSDSSEPIPIKKKMVAVCRSSSPSQSPSTSQQKKNFEIKNGCCKQCLKAFSKSGKSCLCQVPEKVRKTALGKNGCKYCGCKGCNPEDTRNAPTLEKHRKTQTIESDKNPTKSQHLPQSSVAATAKTSQPITPRSKNVSRTKEEDIIEEKQLNLHIFEKTCKNNNIYLLANPFSPYHHRRNRQDNYE